MGSYRFPSAVTLPLLFLVLNLVHFSTCRRDKSHRQAKEYPIDPKYDIPPEEPRVDIKKLRLFCVFVSKKFY